MPLPPAKYGLSLAHELPCDLAAVPDLGRLAREFLAQAGLPEAEIDAWELALVEAANNAVKYCRPEARQSGVRVDLLVTGRWVEGCITDHTPGFDWPQQAQLPPPDSESGRGIFLIQNLTDHSEYLRGRDANCLRLRKFRAAPAEENLINPGAWAAELREARHTLDLMTEELASTYESLSAIFRFSAELQKSGATKEFLSRWLRQLQAITEADWYVLRILDGASQQLSLAAAHPAASAPPVLPLEGRGSGVRFVEVQAASQRNTAWFDEHTPLASDDPLAGLAGPGCGLAHPLVANDALVGVLALGRHSATRPFRAAEVNVIQTFGEFLGLQLRGKQMQEEQVQARLDARDLEIAAKLQRLVLPSQLPSAAGFGLSSYYRSARQVGGDYYDALPLAGGSMLLVVADVMGKGLPAALFGFMFHSLLRAKPGSESQPGKFLAWLNQQLFPELDRAEMFITAQLAYFDGARRTLRVASAGHPPLLLAGADGTAAELDIGGPPLGVEAEVVYAEETRPFAGGLALMFTDGLLEARNSQDSQLGLQALKEALASAARLQESAGATQQRLVTLLKEFEQGTPPADDTAFVVISG